MSNFTKDSQNPSKFSASSSKRSLLPSDPQNPTIINVESYPECEYPERSKYSPEPVFSPRLKQSRREKVAISQSTEKESETKPKKTHFNDFLNKMEQFQKAKNEKLVNLQAVKKVQEEEKLNSMPKVKMSEMSKKILEERKKRNNDGKEAFGRSPSPPKEKMNKASSASTKSLHSKLVIENLGSEIIKPRFITEGVKNKVSSIEPPKGNNLKSFDVPMMRIPVVDPNKMKSLQNFEEPLKNTLVDSQKARNPAETQTTKISEAQKQKNPQIAEIILAKPLNEPPKLKIPQTEPLKIPAKEVPSLAKSEKVLASKLVKEYNAAFEEIGRGKFCLTEKETKILLEKLSFLSGHKDEEKLLEKMWKITGAESTGEISMDNLRTFLLGVMNLFLQSMNHTEAGVQFGRVINNKFFLNQEEVVRVHKHFFLFYNTRHSIPKKLLEVPEKLEIPKDPVKVRIKDTQVIKTLNKHASHNKIENPSKDLKISKVHSVKSLTKKERDSCITPKSRRPADNLNTSFRSARSKSRSKLGQDSVRSSMSESDFAGINNDKISDPSILLKAQDILGAFSSKAKKGDDVKVGKKEEIEAKKEENEKISEGNGSSKLLFKKNTGFKNVNSKAIDDDLKRARELLKSGSRSPDKRGDDIVVEVSMPDGTQKTLIIPMNSNHQNIVNKFVKENNLSSDMGNILLNSIQDS